jgi:nitrite reductase/ring-hydroxylating ferredoxin subunit/uncharacterized membrane protein
MSESPDSDASRSLSDGAGAPRPSRIDQISDALQHAIGAVIGSNRKPPRLLKSWLHGTPLGHPLHPAIVALPIGAWLLTAVFDILWLITPAGNAWSARAAEVTTLVGIATALGAIITGMADWSDSYGRERTIGLLHGLLNLIVTATYGVSAALRLLTASGESIPGAVIGFAGLALVLYTEYLGGEMVFTEGTGVNRTAWEAAGDNFEPVMALADVPDNTLTRALVGGVPVLLVRSGERIAAISATCPHAGGPLDEGTLEHGVVQCPWHGSRFRLRDGHVLTGPATTNAPRYEVRVQEGQVALKRIASH